MRYGDIDDKLEVAPEFLLMFFLLLLFETAGCVQKKMYTDGNDSKK